MALRDGYPERLKHAFDGPVSEYVPGKDDEQPRSETRKQQAFGQKWQHLSAAKVSSAKPQHMSRSEQEENDPGAHAPAYARGQLRAGTTEHAKKHVWRQKRAEECTANG